MPTESCFLPLKLVLLETGNLVLVDSVGKIQWASQTSCIGTTYGQYTLVVSGGGSAALLLLVVWQSAVGRALCLHSSARVTDQPHMDHHPWI